jgi:hypothetical protein
MGQVAADEDGGDALEIYEGAVADVAGDVDSSRGTALAPWMIPSSMAPHRRAARDRRWP